MTHTEARELASQFGSRMCDENGDTHGEELYCVSLDDIIAIKEALAQPEQEPVAWGVFEGNLHDMFFSPSEAQEMADIKGTHAEVRPFYITPPQRTWVGLEKSDMPDGADSLFDDPKFIAGMVYAANKLMEKNT